MNTELEPKEPKEQATTNEGAPGVIVLDDGTELRFGTVVAWDVIAIKRELGIGISQADPFESSLALSWRAACRGGFAGDFEDFCTIVPLDRLPEVTKAVAPHLGKQIAALVGAG